MKAGKRQNRSFDYSPSSSLSHGFTYRIRFVRLSERFK
jgi:hypothetical protein